MWRESSSVSLLSALDSCFGLCMVSLNVDVTHSAFLLSAGNNMAAIVCSFCKDLYTGLCFIPPSPFILAGFWRLSSNLPPLPVALSNYFRLRALLSFIRWVGFTNHLFLPRYKLHGYCLCSNLIFKVFFFKKNSCIWFL